MMLLHTKHPRVDTGTRSNITEQEIVDVKRNFRLYSEHFVRLFAYCLTAHQHYLG